MAQELLLVQLSFSMPHRSQGTSRRTKNRMSIFHVYTHFAYLEGVKFLIEQRYRGVFVKQPKEINIGTSVDAKATFNRDTTVHSDNTSRSRCRGCLRSGARQSGGPSPNYGVDFGSRLRVGFRGSIHNSSFAVAFVRPALASRLRKIVA